MCEVYFQDEDKSQSKIIINFRGEVTGNVYLQIEFAKFVIVGLCNILYCCYLSRPLAKYDY